jgi:hypothetical protein
MVNNRSRTGGVRSMYRWAGVIDGKTHVGVACAGRSMAPHEAAGYGGHVGKVIPFDRVGRSAKVIPLAPIRARRGSLETMIGPKGVRALRWFARLTLVQPPKPTR